MPSYQKKRHLITYSDLLNHIYKIQIISPSPSSYRVQAHSFCWVKHEPLYNYPLEQKETAETTTLSFLCTKGFQIHGALKLEAHEELRWMLSDTGTQRQRRGENMKFPNKENTKEYEWQTKLKDERDMGNRESVHALINFTVSYICFLSARLKGFTLASGPGQRIECISY